MRGHLIIFNVCVILLTALQPENAVAQKESFDIVEYTVPAGYSTQDKDGLRIFIKENKQTGGYCILSLFKSKGAATAIEKDFQTAWSDIVVQAYNGPGKPGATEKSVSNEDWTAMSGSALLKIDGADAMALLTVFNNKQKTISVFALLNDNNYAAEIDQFLQAIEINQQAHGTNRKTQPPVQNNQPVSTTHKITGMQTYGNFLYQLPNGWTSQQQPNYLELFPQELREHEIFSILLLKGNNSNAPLQQELAACWDEFAIMMNAQKMREVSGKQYLEDEIHKTAAGWEYLAGHGSIRTGSNFFVHAYVIRTNGRSERVIVLSKEIRLDGLRNNIDPSRHHYPYYVAITDFIFNLRFANLNSPVLPNAAWKGTGISGVWAGLGFTGGAIKTMYAVFFSNGQVFYGNPFPVQGLFQLDTYAEKERSIRNWGTYSFQNGKGNVTMPFGSFPIRMEADKLVFTPIREEHKFIKMAAIDNIRLNGTWAIKNRNGKWVTVSFSPGGKFTDNGAVRVLDHTVYDYYSVADGGGTGSYLIKDHSLIFQYSDGRVLSIAFPGMQFIQNNNSPEKLVLSSNNDVLQKQ